MPVQKSLRLSRTRKTAIHWITPVGEVACRTPLDAESFTNGKAVKDRDAVSCGACSKIIEALAMVDFFGRPVQQLPKPDLGPLFKNP